MLKYLISLQKVQHPFNPFKVYDIENENYNDERTSSNKHARIIVRDYDRAGQQWFAGFTGKSTVLISPVLVLIVLKYRVKRAFYALSVLTFCNIAFSRELNGN